MRHLPRRPTRRRRLAPRGWLAAVCLVVTTAAGARAQDLEPRAYAASPVGAFFIVAGVSRSSGGVVTDPTLPVQNVDARVYALPLAAGYTFALAGRLALVTAALPIAHGDVSGDIGEATRSVTRTGLTDVRGKLSINLTGNPPMAARDFARSPRRTVLGTSVTVVAPTGQYKGSQLINLGTNRWAFKPEVGIGVPKGQWDFDAYLGVWLFTSNADFYPGGRARAQDPVITLQGHSSYTFRPRLWVAVDATWYRGGGATVEGGTPIGGMSNARLGATVSLPLRRSQSVKIAYSSGVAVRSGTNFRTLSVGWQWLRLTKF